MSKRKIANKNTEKRINVKQPLLIILSLFIANIISFVTLFLLQETHVHNVLCPILPIFLTIIVPFLVGYISKGKFSKKDIIPLLIIELVTVGIAIFHYKNIYSTNYILDIISGYYDILNFSETVILEFVTSRYYETFISETFVYSIVSIIYPMIVFASYFIGGSIKSKKK